eukprot:4728412-Alexandrium_andersonii.AAC.1
MPWGASLRGRSYQLAQPGRADGGPGSGPWVKVGRWARPWAWPWRSLLGPCGGKALGWGLACHPPRPSFVFP